MGLIVDSDTLFFLHGSSSGLETFGLDNINQNNVTINSDGISFAENGYITAKSLGSVFGNEGVNGVSGSRERFTFEFYYKFTGISSTLFDDREDWVFSVGSYPKLWIKLNFGNYSGDNVVRPYFYIEGVDAYYTLKTEVGDNYAIPPNVRDGNWHHYALILSDSGIHPMSLYVDGLLVETKGNNQSSSPTIGMMQNDILRFGNQSINGTKAIQGIIQDIRISKNIRYTDNFIPEPITQPIYRLYKDSTNKVYGVNNDVFGQVVED